MSPRRHSASAQRRAQAPIFAALGDEVRLSLLAKLACGRRYSISQLTKGSRLTRQAVTKHLRVLERAKIVRCARAGRKCLFQLDPRPVQQVRDYLDQVSVQWDNALLRLKSFIETKHPM